MLTSPESRAVKGKVYQGLQQALRHETAEPSERSTRSHSLTSQEREALAKEREQLALERASLRAEQLALLEAQRQKETELARAKSALAEEQKNQS